MDKSLSNPILFTDFFKPGKIFLFFFSLAGWGEEEVDGGRGVEVEPRENVEGVRDGGEG